MKVKWPGARNAVPYAIARASKAFHEPAVDRTSSPQPSPPQEEREIRLAL
jgi:hypothetical protein